MLCAGLLTAGDLALSNVPRLHDVRTMLKLLAQMGVQVDAATTAKRHARTRASSTTSKRRTSW